MDIRLVQVRPLPQSSVFIKQSQVYAQLYNCDKKICTVLCIQADSVIIAQT